MSDQNNSNISRRNLLKMLSATGLTAGIHALLPSEWATPAIAAVEQEAHPDGLNLSGGGAFFLTNASTSFTPNGSTLNGVPFCLPTVSIYFVTNGIQLSNSSILTAYSSQLGSMYNAVPISSTGAAVHYITNESGSISVPYTDALLDGTFDCSSVLITESSASDSIGVAFNVSCDAPELMNLQYAAGVPVVASDFIQCRYRVLVDYSDATGAISGNSMLTVSHGSILILHASLDALGIAVPSNVSGTLAFEIDLRDGQTDSLEVTLQNDALVSSNTITSDSFTADCGDVLSYDVAGQSVSGANASNTWQICFDYSDDAGLVSNDTPVYAWVSGGATLLNGVPLWMANGSAIVNSVYNNSFDNFVLNGMVSSTVYGANGSGCFNVVYNAPPTARGNAVVNWQIGNNNSDHLSNIEAANIQPTAVNLKDVNADEWSVGSLGTAVAGAAALGAATIAAQLKASSEEE